MQPVEAANTPIRVMAFNIRVDNGGNTLKEDAWISTNGGPNRRDLAINVINTFDPDILAVQESLTNQVTDLQNALPGSDFYGDGATGLGIFYRSSRFTRTDQGTFWLTETPEVPSQFPGAGHVRIASWVTLTDNQAGGQEYFVLNTHWDNVSEAARDFSAGLVRDRIESLSGDRPLIVLGDLNTFDTSPAYLDLIGENDPNGFQLTDSYRVIDPVNDMDEATFNNFTGITAGNRIDFILHAGFASTEDAAIDRTEFSGNYPSDHYPVTAILHPVPEPSTLALIAVSTISLLTCRRCRRMRCN